MKIKDLKPFVNYYFYYELKDKKGNILASYDKQTSFLELTYAQNVRVISHHEPQLPQDDFKAYAVIDRVGWKACVIRAKAFVAWHKSMEWIKRLPYVISYKAHKKSLKAIVELSCGTGVYIRLGMTGKPIYLGDCEDDYAFDFDNFNKYKNRQVQQMEVDDGFLCLTLEPKKGE